MRKESLGIDLHERVDTALCSASHVADDFNGLCNSGQFLSAAFHGSLVICSCGGTVFFHVGLGLLGLLEVSSGNTKVALLLCHALSCLGLVALRLPKLLSQRSALISEGLLQHVILVCSLHLGLTQGRQLLLGLVLHILQDIQDGAAVGFVCGCCWCTQFLIVVLSRLLALHKRHQLLAISPGEGCNIDDGTEGVHQALHVSADLLLQESWVLGHLLGEDADRTAECVDGVHELCL
mmetsp:Transcript_48407/g.89158  ORF Transcript_48407/g.89158 Transcript_48407/m.89158 type:complete len:236 (-) Transcript_48407:448-1155(-)